MAKLSNFNIDNKNSEPQNQKVSQEELYQKYNEYKDLSQSQLNNELFKEVSRQKQNGTFNYQQLESMLEGLRPTLGEENYKNMKRILENLR